jgi:S1-C subfamily serine protease
MTFAVPSYILKEFIEKSIVSASRARHLEGLELKKFGIILEQRGDGVYISAVQKGSPAWLASLKKGMKINSINNREVQTLKNAAEASESTEDPGRVNLYLDDNSSRYFIILSR